MTISAYIAAAGIASGLLGLAALALGLVAGLMEDVDDALSGAVEWLDAD